MKGTYDPLDDIGHKVQMSSSLLSLMFHTAIILS